MTTATATPEAPTTTVHPLNAFFAVALNLKGKGDILGLIEEGDRPTMENYLRERIKANGRIDLMVKALFNDETIAVIESARTSDADAYSDIFKEMDKDFRNGCAGAFRSVFEGMSKAECQAAGFDFENVQSMIQWAKFGDKDFNTVYWTERLREMNVPKLSSPPKGTDANLIARMESMFGLPARTVTTAS